MHMGIRYQNVETCICPLSVMLTRIHLLLLEMQMLYAMTEMDLAIEIMNVGRRNHLPMETSGTILINSEAIIGYMSSKDLHGTR